MSIEKAKEHLKKYSLEDRVQEFEVSSATVALAAQALGCDPDRIAKSLSFKVDDKAILVVASGMARIDNHKFKETFHKKATMLTSDEVDQMIGHKVGGVCPFGINDGVSVYLDQSLKAYDIVYPACGSSNTAVKLTIEELEKTSGYISWVDVCKKGE